MNPQPGHHQAHLRPGPLGRLRMPRPYRVCDGLTEGLLYGALLFGPWAFGTTQDWAIWTLTVVGVVLGLLLAAKRMIRWRTGYSPVRWGEGLNAMAAGPSSAGPASPPPQDPSGRGAIASVQGSQTATLRRGNSLPAGRFLTFALAALTGLVLVWCLVSVVNARASYDPERRAFTYFECLRWLPHSYDRASSWFMFWQVLGWAGLFWALRDWLLGLSAGERQGASEGPGEGRFGAGMRLPVRVKRLLWLLCVQGAVLALVAMLNRLDGSNKILWLIQARRPGGFHFGPYAYRGNASQYLNLLWPVCLGFWWALRQEAKRSHPGGRRAGSGAHSLLLPCAVLMAAGPVMSASRGGLLIALLLAGVTTLTLMLGGTVRSVGWRAAVAVLLVGTVGLGLYLGWDRVVARLSTAAVAVPTGVDLGTNDFAVRVVFRPERSPTNGLQALVGLSETDQGTSWRPHGFEVVIAPNENLHHMRFDATGQRYALQVIGNFMKRFGSNEVDLVFLKTATPRAYVNGSPAALSVSPKGSEGEWAEPVGTTYFWVGGRHPQDASRVSPILGAALYNHARFVTNESGLVLPPLSETPSGSGRTLFSADFRFSPDGFAGAEAGLLLTNEMVDVVTEAGVLRAQRNGEPGGWRLTKSDLATTNPFPVEVRVTLQVENPSAQECTLGIGFGDRAPALRTMAARTNTSVSAVFEGLSEEELARLSLTVVDPTGQARRDLGTHFGLGLRQVRVDQLGAVVALDFADEPLTSRLNVDQSGREVIYAAARRIADDFPWFGSGPGTFMTMAELYRDEVTGKWPAYVHDDWLECRVTFGWIGFGLVAGLLVLAILGPWMGQGMAVPGVLLAQVYAAMAGCLLHAKFDFPFQVHSVVVLFLVWCALCLTSRRSGGHVRGR